jgi:hypothetical protein
VGQGLIGSVVVSGIFQSPWVSPDPSLVAVILVAAIGGATLDTQRTIWPALV